MTQQDLRNRSVPALPVTMLAPAEEADRRADRRYRAVYRIAPVHTDHDYGMARVRNISDGGMAIDIGFPVCLGDRIWLTLADDVVLGGRVVWSRDGECGVGFDAPVDSVRVLRDTAATARAPHARAPRLPIERTAIASSEAGVHAVEVRDVSQRGMTLAHDGQFTPGVRVKVRLGSGVERRGVVRWAHDGLAGLLLTEPFTPQELGAVSAL